ncbi:glycosyltransferase [Stutzerimonas stutzeri]
MPKISIIVPAHNAIGTIERCVDSLIAQSLKDIEIVIVDDFSTDGTTQKLIEYAKNHKRVRLLINSDNLSASVCRKRGTLASTGEYIMYVDADDKLNEHACEIAYNQIKIRKVDILQFKVAIRSEGATRGQVAWFENFVNNKPSQKITGSLVKRCFTEKLFGFTLWNKIYKSDIAKIAVSKVTNEPIYKAQDVLLQFFILLYSLTYDSIEDTLYEYSYGAGITGGVDFDKRKILKHMSQSCVVREIYNHFRTKELKSKYLSSIQSIALSLIEDNLATVAKCAGSPLEEFAKETFIDSWGVGRSREPNDYNESIFGSLAPVFEKISSNEIFKNLTSRPDFNINSDISFSLSHLRNWLSNNTEKVIPVVMAVNEKYTPYLSIAVESIKLHNKSKVFLCIFFTEINSSLIQKVKSLADKNLHIEFINVAAYIEIEKLYSRAHYSIEMYYRLIIPEIFSFTPKVIYLDCDIVVMDDLHGLYIQELGENVVGAARNPIHKGMHEYLNNKLQFPYKQYFNSGVLIINTVKFIDEKIKMKCLRFLEENRDLACPDQDALNVTCKGMVKFIDQQWNFQWHHAVRIKDKPLMTPLLDDEKTDYFSAKENIKILHYTSNIKPWNSPSQDLSVHFWQHARNSPFYMDILSENINP